MRIPLRAVHWQGEEENSLRSLGGEATFLDQFDPTGESDLKPNAVLLFRRGVQESMQGLSDE